MGHRICKAFLWFSAGALIGAAALICVFTFAPALKPFCVPRSQNVLEPVTAAPTAPPMTAPPSYNATMLLSRSRRTSFMPGRPRVRGSSETDLACKFLKVTNNKIHTRPAYRCNDSRAPRHSTSKSQLLAAT